jgi:hypothetical protein
MPVYLMRVWRRSSSYMGGGGESARARENSREAGRRERKGEPEMPEQGRIRTKEIF